jgi:hypothetical protein
MRNTSGEVFLRDVPVSNIKKTSEDRRNKKSKPYKKFDDAYSLLYGSGNGDENKTVAKAIFIAPRKSLTELDDQLRQACCKECGEDHSFRPTFEGVKTSMNVIPEMLQQRRRQPNPSLQ